LIGSGLAAQGKSRTLDDERVANLISPLHLIEQD
jgi:hypothetical protein